MLLCHTHRVPRPIDLKAHAGKQTDRQKKRTDIHTDRHTDRYTDGWTDRQTDRQQKAEDKRVQARQADRDIQIDDKTDGRTEGHDSYHTFVICCTLHDVYLILQYCIHEYARKHSGRSARRAGSKRSTPLQYPRCPRIYII